MTIKVSKFIHPNIQMPLGRKMQMYPPPAGSVLYLPGYPPLGATVIDQVGTNDGTITGATWVRNAKGLWGLSFDGDDYVDCGDADSLSFTDGAGNDVACTILAVINPTNYNNTNSIITKRASATVAEWQFALAQTTGLLQFILYKGDDAAVFIKQTSDAAVGTGSRILVGVTYTGSELNTGITLYKNGAAIAQTAGSGGAYAGMTNTASKVRIGAIHTVLTNYFIGSQYLHLIIRGTGWSAAQHANFYNQIKSLI